MCEEASQLLGLYTSALSDFHHAQSGALNGPDPSGPEFREAKQAQEMARAALLAARRRYWDHVGSHGCRQETFAPRGEEARSARSVDWLWRRLGDAKIRLDRAHRSLEDIRQDRLPEPMTSADGAFTYKQALRVQASAADEYLGILNDLKAALLEAGHSAVPETAQAIASAREDPHRPDSLTPREREVFTHIASGKTSREVAELLGIAFKTVVVHRHRIYTKLGIHKASDLTLAALRLGVIEL